jgi:beta-lactam-binding protein with PASTA domain
VGSAPVERPAGTRVPKSSRVVVRHYGPTAVPDVVGQYRAAACDLIEGAKLVCVPRPREDTAPTPQDLDVVKQQTPGNGEEASTGDEVVVSYHDKALLADYRAQAGTTACGALTQTYRTVRCQVVEGATEQVTGKPPGVVYEQQPPPGGTVRSGEMVDGGAVVIHYPTPPRGGAVAVRGRQR